MSTDFAVSFLSESLTPRPVGRLAVPIEFMRFCDLCGNSKRFIAEEVCESGLIGFCVSCEEEALVPFSRVNGEVA